MNLKKLWKERRKIIEGWFYLKLPFLEKEKARNFRRQIVAERNKICVGCAAYDIHGVGCEVKGTQPCCSLEMGGCGCSLGPKQHSLSSECPKGKWKAIFTSKQAYDFEQNLAE